MSSKIWTAEDLRELGFLPEEPEVHSITSAQAPHSESIDRRFRSYALKMFLRIVFIFAALFTDGWMMWVCIAAAAILPWVAVVAANGESRSRNEDFSAYLSIDHQLALGTTSRDSFSSTNERSVEYEVEVNTDGSDGQTEMDDDGIIEGEVVEERKP